MKLRGGMPRLGDKISKTGSCINLQHTELPIKIDNKIVAKRVYSNRDEIDSKQRCNYHSGLSLNRSYNTTEENFVRPNLTVNLETIRNNSYFNSKYLRRHGVPEDIISEILSGDPEAIKYFS
jgi:hypothetical protein